MKRSGSSTSFGLRRITVFALLAGAGAVLADEPAVAAKPELKPLNVPLPVGQKAKTLKIPQFNLAGQIMSQLLAGQVQRVDDEFLRIDQLKLDLFDEGGQSEFVIDLPVSLFSTKTRIITSDQAVFIRHKDFDLTGSRLEFNTATRKGRLSGPVTMTIRDLDRVVEKNPPLPPVPATPEAGEPKEK